MIKLDTQAERLADWIMFHIPEISRWMMVGWRETMRDEAVELAKQMLDAAVGPQDEHHVKGIRSPYKLAAVEAQDERLREALHAIGFDSIPERALQSSDAVRYRQIARVTLSKSSEKNHD